MPLKGGLEVDKGRIKGTDEPREFLKPFVTLFGQPARDKTVTRRNNPDSHNLFSFVLLQRRD